MAAFPSASCLCAFAVLTMFCFVCSQNALSDQERARLAAQFVYHPNSGRSYRRHSAAVLERLDFGRPIAGGVTARADGSSVDVSSAYMYYDGIGHQSNYDAYISADAPVFDIADTDEQLAMARARRERIGAAPAPAAGEDRLGRHPYSYQRIQQDKVQTSTEEQR